MKVFTELLVHIHNLKYYFILSCKIQIISSESNSTDHKVQFMQGTNIAYIFLVLFLD